MPVSGALAHIDISIGHPERSIPFYEAFLGTLGYRRTKIPLPEWSGTNPTRATWGLQHPGAAHFGIEVRPARRESRDRAYDRYEPGPHHIAFHAESRAVVHAVYDAMLAIGATILDPPADYGGHLGYEEGYYAAFFADPDGVKLEVVHLPRENP